MESKEEADFTCASPKAGMWFVVSIPKEDGDDKVASEAVLQETTPEKGAGDTESFVNATPTEIPLKQVLQDCLDMLNITNAVWCATNNDKFYQVCFPCESGEKTDEALLALTNKGIGTKGNSTVGVVPCAIFYSDVETEKSDVFGEEDHKSDGTEKKDKGFKAMQKKFLKSVTSRLTVAQVVADVRAQGELNFDFVGFILFAGMIAALGLMDNNVVSIIAAMLVSPLMGPIMAITFGIIIQDRSLVRVGLKTEIFGLLLCLIFGFLLGFVNAYWGDIPPSEGNSWSNNPWPNPEMASRGQWRSLWVGALVALPSGGGVAMAILGGNAGCLVGVAISASLLPPIINCGILWAISVMKVLKSLFQDPILVEVNGELLSVPPSYLAPKNFEASYFDNYSMHKECAVLGAVSFCLTVINIICIIIAGIVILKIKEIAPASSLQSTGRFWRHDIQVTRDYNKTVGGTDARNLGNELLKEMAKLEGRDLNDLEYRDHRVRDLCDIIDEAEEDEVYQTVMQCVSKHPTVNLLRQLSRTFTVPALIETPNGSRMNVWDIENSILESNDQPRVKPSFKRKRSRSENCAVTFQGLDDPVDSDERTAPTSPRRRQFLNFSSFSRFRVSRVNEGHPRQPTVLQRMRNKYRSVPPIT